MYEQVGAFALVLNALVTMLLVPVLNHDSECTVPGTLRDRQVPLTDDFQLCDELFIYTLYSRIASQPRR